MLDTLALSTNGARFQAIPEYETGVIRLWDREDGPPPALMNKSVGGSRAASDTRGREVTCVGRHEYDVAYDASVTDTRRPGELSTLQRDENLAATGRLSQEEMEKAMQTMALGRSPVSGNPVTGKGRFG